MASQANIDFAQKMYVSYYGRPADPSGLAYWSEVFETSTNLDQALTAFGESAEYTASFGDLDSTALVTNLFQQMFSRTPDAVGLAFYVDAIAAGTSTLISVALDVANGAQNNDSTTLVNRLSVANTYTNAIETNAATYTSADIVDAKAILASVDETAASITTGETAAEAEVVAIVAATAATAAAVAAAATATASHVGTVPHDPCLIPRLMHASWFMPHPTSGACTPHAFRI